MTNVADQIVENLRRSRRLADHHSMLTPAGDYLIAYALPAKS